VRWSLRAGIGLCWTALWITAAAGNDALRGGPEPAIPVDFGTEIGAPEAMGLMRSQEWDAALKTDDFGPAEAYQDLQPVQYPLENNIFEDRDPEGRPLDPVLRERDWRDESVYRREDCLFPTAQAPFVEWTNSRWLGEIIPRTPDGVGFTNFEFRGTMKFPRVPFMWVTPRAAWHFTNAPDTAPDDLPKQYYDASVDTTFAAAWDENRWIVQLVVAPSVFTDFENTKDAFRLAGRVVAIRQWNETTQIMAGVSHTGRKDLPWVPIGGVTYVPNENLRYEMLIPRPRVAYRYYNDGDRERWAYVAGEFGGGSWAVRRASGADDMMTYRDLQLLVGIEHREPGTVNWQLEVGYLFSRAIEWESGIGDRDLSATGIMRLAVSF
jgi:hypothetical protein